MGSQTYRSLNFQLLVGILICRLAPSKGDFAPNDPASLLLDRDVLRDRVDDRSPLALQITVQRTNLRVCTLRLGEEFGELIKGNGGGQLCRDCQVVVQNSGFGGRHDELGDEGSGLCR